MTYATRVARPAALPLLVALASAFPALALDNGLVLSEITAICEYLDEVGPAGKTLVGATPEERAETRMWARRIDLKGRGAA